MNYLVTGGMGFVGSHVVRLLLKQGHHVTIFDQKSKALLPKQMEDEFADSRIQVINGDIIDINALIKVCRDINVDAIIHTAAVIGSENPALTAKINCDGTINVLDTAKLLGLKRVVCTSSLAVFGPPEKYREEYISNDAPHFPENIYGASKSFGEYCANYYFKAFSLDVISIRLTHVYGIGRSTEGIGKIIDDELFRKPALGQTGRVPSGDSIHNWIYVEDAARALVMASQVNQTKSRAFTAGGYFCSIRDVAAYIKSLIPGADIVLLPGKTNYAYKFDVRPIKEQIGYEPLWSLEDGTRAIIDQVHKQYVAY